MVEVGLDVGAFLRAGGVQIVERNTKHVLVEEQERGKGLVLSGCGNLFLGGKVAEELFDFGCAHVFGVAQVVEADVTLVPLDIGFLSADGVSAQEDGFTEAVGEFFLCHGFCS